MLTNWENTPFRIASGSLCLSNTETELPFSIGSITRQGFEHIRLGISNQDYINIKISEKLLVGVLCDGCTTNSEKHISDFSSNEFAAQALSEMIANLCFENIKPRKNRVNLENFMSWLNKHTQKNMEKVLWRLGVKKSVQQELFQFQNMTTTVVGFVIREKEYFLFHCGDGIAKVNKNLYDLSHDSGTYFGSTKEAKFKIFHTGQTDDLKTVMIASDGFSSIPILESESFNRFYNSKKNFETGYIDLIPEFHIEVLNKFYPSFEVDKKWPKDDSSMILIRRANKKTKQ